MFTFKVIGKASNKEIATITVKSIDESKTILEFLREKGIPVASSCLGEGVCKMCIINDEKLSCLHFVREIRDWPEKSILINYL